MRRTPYIALAFLWLAGCATWDHFVGESSVQQRVADYNDDGRRLFQNGDFAGARDSFQAALAIKPNDPGLLFNLGQCYERLAVPARAEELYRQSLQRAADNSACRFALVAVQVRQGKKAEAAQIIAEWLTREPKRAAAYATDGWYWHQAGDLPRAQARLQQALELDPHDTLALTELGRVYEEMKRPDRAIALYERALAQDPKQADLTNRINFLLAKGAGKPKPD